MEEPIYHNIEDFVNKTSNGDIQLVYAIPLNCMNGNKVHKISFMDHCQYLAKKHNTDILRLLLAIQQKMNGDMLVRLDQSKLFKDKIHNLLSEWDYNDLSPEDLFKLRDNNYNLNSFNELESRLNLVNERFNIMNSMNNDSDIYDELDDLRTEYKTNLDDLLSELDNINSDNFSDILDYYSILSELATKDKSFYLNNLVNDDNNLSRNVNLQIKKNIPDNINIIFLNITLLPTLIAKEIEKLKNRCYSLKDNSEKKILLLDELMEKMGNRTSLSDDILSILSNITSIFDNNDDDDDNETDNDISQVIKDDDRIKEAMNQIINKKQGDILIRSNEDDEQDIEQDDEQDAEDDNNETDEESEYKLMFDKEDNDNTSFF
jgi:hypothetical protein